MKENKIKNKKSKDILPNLDSFSQNREEYILTLEMAVQLLQREVEHLRNQARESETITNKGESQYNIELIKKASSIFSDSSTSNDVLNRLHNELAELLSVKESNIYFFTSDRQLFPIAETDISSTLTEHVKYMEEEGIIDWILEKKEPNIIPNLRETNENMPKFIILAPLFLRGKSIGIYVAKTSKQLNDFSFKEIEKLSIYTGQAAIALDNIRSAEEISKINVKLSVLNKQMLQSSSLASFGQFAGSFAREIDVPLKILKGNLKLFESGLGDSKRRLEIISEQVEKIDEITSRLSELSILSLEKTPSTINVCTLIEEVLLFSGSQLQRDGINIEKEYEDFPFNIIGYKPQIEQVILNLLLFSRDSMPEGGTITIGVYKAGKNNVLISISDTGKGINDKDSLGLFEPSASFESEPIRIGMGLFIIKNIIQQHKGLITAASEEGKGTTFKITLPLR